MLSFEPLDWYKVRDKDCISIHADKEYKRNGSDLIGKEALISGKKYKIIGLEKFALGHPLLRIGETCELMLEAQDATN